MTTPADHRADPGLALGTFAGAATLAAAAALLVAAFLPWTTTGVVAVDIAMVGSGARAGLTLGSWLVVLAAAPAIAVLVTRRAWVRVAGAVLAGGTVLLWLADGPDAALTAGVWTAIAGACALLLAAALAD